VVRFHIREFIPLVSMNTRNLYSTNG